MRAYENQLSPQERERLHYVGNLLARGGMPTREQVSMLQQDYLRLKVRQEGTLGQVEEHSVYLMGGEVDAAQAARVQLDGGSLLTHEQMKGLDHARSRVALPTILAQLEQHAPLLSDMENHVLMGARIMFEMQGTLDEKTLNEINKLQHALAARQYIF